MLQIIEESKGNLVALRASGKLDKSDYDVMLPMLKEKIKQYGKVRAYIELEYFDEITPKALWQELQFDVKHASDVSKAAIVGNKKWEEWLTAAAKPFIGGEMKFFNTNERDAAWAWINEGVTETA